MHCRTQWDHLDEHTSIIHHILHDFFQYFRSSGRYARGAWEWEENRDIRHFGSPKGGISKNEYLKTRIKSK